MSNATQSAVRGNPRDPGGNGRTAFGGIDKSAVRYTPEHVDFSAIQQSPEFRSLRSRLKWFVFPATAFFLIWYLGYVVLAAYAPDFMAQRVFGEVNVGLLMGIGQFATTLLLTTLYARYARKHLDPQVDELRENAGGAA
ncbi:DUF485 domain-containing protein [Saccharopolyspora sp. HNM0983]|uniref:DUF485 domain-containing protein n=1 Tax=Saccharopolyspora montiporae TaxID=2781240 RepID=A0A929FZ34_9PSEU|nr:DUF485 domain-containing protein [Saccharopolyspora sp. HNM0983]MBE9373974.1 DUF485 domain-containing protein [Saccharopolyspora sp. HNM0983]